MQQNEELEDVFLLIDRIKNNFLLSGRTCEANFLDANALLMRDYFRARNTPPALRAPLAFASQFD